MTADIPKVTLNSTIREVMEVIDRNALGVALLVDDGDRLLNVLSDGDIRRCLLRKLDLDAPISVLTESKVASGGGDPITVPDGTESAEILALMRRKHLRVIPVVDAAKRIVRMALMEDFIGEAGVTAVIMAGGFGQRLRPLTENVPKPMLKVGDQPLLQHAIERLRDAGMTQVNVTVHYKKEVITEYFGDGSGFGVDIEYLVEDQPLGTAGAVAQVAHNNHTILVMNGDVLTNVDFRAMLDFHRQNKSSLTMAVAQYEVTIPYGVVEVEDVCVKRIVEKPTSRYFVNTGIYLLEPEACSMIPPGTFYNMTDLVERLMKEGKRVVTFPVREYWRDIGRLEDFQQANLDILNLGQTAE